MSQAIRTTLLLCAFAIAASSGVSAYHCDKGRCNSYESLSRDSVLLQQGRASRLSLRNLQQGAKVNAANLMQVAVDLAKNGITPELESYADQMRTLANQSVTKIFEDHELDSRMLIAAYSKFAELEEQLRQDAADAGREESIASVKRDNHIDCRKQEDMFLPPPSLCESDLREAEERLVLRKDAIAAAHDKLVSRFSQRFAADAEAHLTTGFRTNGVSEAQAYIDAENTYQIHYAALQALRDNCTNMTASHSSKKVACNAKQRDFESQVCTYANAVHHADAYLGRYASQKADYEEDVRMIKLKVADRKVEYSAMKQLDCILLELANSDEFDKPHGSHANSSEVIAGCATQELALEMFDIAYNATPSHAQTPTMPLLPCLEDYTGVEYEVYGSASLCIPCTEPWTLTPPTPTPTSTDPRTSTVSTEVTTPSPVTSQTTASTTSTPPKACTRSPSNHDAGWADSYRGWYDVQGCGTCNDYCRWVGNSGSGGDPRSKVVHRTSRWNCRRAGTDERFSPEDWVQGLGGWKYAKCSGEGATAPDWMASSS